ALESAASETFADACERVHELRKADVQSADDEIRRLRRFAVPHIGKVEVSKLLTPDLDAVLDATKAKGKSKQTVQHLKQDIANVFAVLKREGAIKTNPAEASTLPKFEGTV